MTTEEIKRAFDICCDTQGCTGCPLLALEQQNGCDCRHNLFVSAIDLATEQEREIAQLKDENIRLRGKLAKLLLSIDTVKEMKDMRYIDDQIKRAVKDFADEIKDYINNKVEDEYGDMSDSVNYITIDIDEFETFIDNLLEEQNRRTKNNG